MGYLRRDREKTLEQGMDTGTTPLLPLPRYKEEVQVIVLLWVRTVPDYERFQVLEERKDPCIPLVSKVLGNVNPHLCLDSRSVNLGIYNVSQRVGSENVSLMNGV